MASTDLLIRGLMDKLIEEQLDDESLSSRHGVFELFKTEGAVRGDRRDAIFGFIMGAVITNFFTDFQKIYGRGLNSDEMKISVEAFQKRVFRIKSRIDETFT